ncbi:MAG: DUF4199 domain-containing protein [Bacteroidota bacterium]
MKTIAIKYGLYFFAGLVVIFLASYLMGVAADYQLRIINGILHPVILYYGIKQLRLDQPETHQNYVSGVAQGMYVGAVGTVLFMVFMILFLSFNPAFMAELQTTTGWGDRLNPTMAGVFIFMEGIGVSLIGSYLITRWVDMRLEQKAGVGQAYASRGDL